MRRAATALVLLAALVSGAHAITLEQALAQADAAPDVVVARAEAEVARAEARLARVRPNPTLSFATHSITARASIALALPLGAFGRRRTAIAAANAQADAQSAALEETRAAARHEAATAWLGLRAAQGRADAAGDRAARAGDAADAVTALFEAGRVARLEQVRAKAEASAALADAAAAREEVAGAAALLGALLGSDPAQPLAAEGDAAPAGTVSTDTIGAKDSASWRAAEAKLAAVRADLASERAQARPDLQLDAGADMADPTEPGVDASVGFDVVVPLGRSAREGVLAARASVGEAEAEATRRELERDLVRARSDERASLARLKALDEAAIPEARESAELARVAYDAGRADLLQLLDAQRRLAEVESARWDAWLEHGLASAEVAWREGR